MKKGFKYYHSETPEEYEYYRYGHSNVDLNNLSDLEKKDIQKELGADKFEIFASETSHLMMLYYGDYRISCERKRYSTGEINYSHLIDSLKDKVLECFIQVAKEGML